MSVSLLIRLQIHPSHLQDELTHSFQPACRAIVLQAVTAPIAWQIKSYEGVVLHKVLRREMPLPKRPAIGEAMQEDYEAARGSGLIGGETSMNVV